MCRRQLEIIMQLSLNTGLSNSLDCKILGLAEIHIFLWPTGYPKLWNQSDRSNLHAWMFKVILPIPSTARCIKGQLNFPFS